MILGELVNGRKRREMRMPPSSTRRSPLSVTDAWSWLAQTAVYSGILRYTRYTPVYSGACGVYPGILRGVYRGLGDENRGRSRGGQGRGDAENAVPENNFLLRRRDFPLPGKCRGPVSEKYAVPLRAGARKF